MRFDVSHVEDNHGSILNPWCAVKRTAMESLAVVVLVLSMDTDSHDENHMACWARKIVIFSGHSKHGSSKNLQKSGEASDCNAIILTHTMDTRDIDMAGCYHSMHLPLSSHWPYHLQRAPRPDCLFGSLNSLC